RLRHHVPLLREDRQPEERLEPVLDRRRVLPRRPVPAAPGQTAPGQASRPPRDLSRWLKPGIFVSLKISSAQLFSTTLRLLPLPSRTSFSLKIWHSYSMTRKFFS